MKINSSYLLATKVEKIPENPDSGMVKRDGVYYPSWATDYLIVSAADMYSAGGYVMIGNTGGEALAAGRQSSGGYCLIYFARGDAYSYWEVSADTGVPTSGVYGEGYMTRSGGQCWTFETKEAALKAILTGTLGAAVYVSNKNELKLTGYLIRYNFSALSYIGAAKPQHYAGGSGSMTYDFTSVKQGLYTRVVVNGVSEGMTWQHSYWLSKTIDYTAFSPFGEYHLSAHPLA